MSSIVLHEGNPKLFIPTKKFLLFVRLTELKGIPLKAASIIDIECSPNTKSAVVRSSSRVLLEKETEIPFHLWNRHIACND